MADAMIAAAALPNLIATVFLATLAYVVLRARRTDAANRAFAAFLGLVALNYVLVGLADALVPDNYTARPPISEALVLAAFAVQILDPVALVWFAGIYPTRSFLASRAARGAVVAVALVLELALLADPEFMTGRLSPGRFLVEAYVIVTYGLVLGAFLVREARRPPGSPPTLPRGFLLGWAVVVLMRPVPALGSFTQDFGLAESLGVTLPAVRGLLATFAEATVSWGVTLVALLALLPFARPARRREIALLLGQVALVVLALLLVLHAHDVFALLVHGGHYPEGETFFLLAQDFLTHSRFAIRWFFFAAVAGPAILANQVFAIEARLRRGLVAGVVGGTLLVIFVTATLLVEGAITDQGTIPVKTTVMLVLLVLLATQAAHLGRRVGDRYFPPERERSETYRRLRRFEVYRDAARAVAEGRAPATDLDRLRVALGLGEEEARLAVAIAEPRARDVPLAAGVVLARRYELVRPIGRGGHGRVFLAKDRRDNRLVAVKEVAAGPGDGSIAAIEREILAGGRLQHPHVLPALDYFVESSSAYVVTEYMRGGSVADRLRERGALPAPEAARVAADVLRGLEAAHAAGVLHRDVKPANVLLDEGGRARLADFGVALVRAADRTATSVFDPRVPGTLAYLPPEALGGGAPDPRWDVYAVGTLLFEALAGRLPAGGEDAPPSAPPALAAVVAKARADEPGERYAGAREMLRDLEAAAEALPPPAGAGSAGHA